MKDTIYREDAIKALHKHFSSGFDKDRWWNSTTVLFALNSVPSADRPQGEWFMGNRPLEGKFRIFRCSVCGYEPFYKGEPITPTNMTLLYCPNCGARMKGADDE